jgi:hypothetical protein
LELNEDPEMDGKSILCCKLTKLILFSKILTNAK